MERTVILRALKYLKGPQIFSIALMIWFTLLNVSHRHFSSGRCIPSNKLCIGSNLKIEYQSTVGGISENGISTRIGSKRRNEDSLTSFKRYNAAFPSRRRSCTKSSFFFQLPFRFIEKWGRPFSFTSHVLIGIAVRFPLLTLNKSSAFGISAMYYAIIKWSQCILLSFVVRNNLSSAHFSSGFVTQLIQRCKLAILHSLPFFNSKLLHAPHSQLEYTQLLRIRKQFFFVSYLR